MRHNVAGRKFGRTANQRKALLRGLAHAVIEHGRIETTVAKAKEARRIVEKLVTLAKRGDLHAKRLVMKKLPQRDMMQKLFDEIAPRFADRNGGYMRIVQTRQRVNDRADMAILEFVDYEDIRDKNADGKKETAKKKTKAKKAEVKAEDTPKAKAETKVAAKTEETSEDKKPAAKKKAPAKKKAAPKKEAADDKEPAAKKKAPAKKKAAPKKKAADDKEPAAKKKAPAKKKAAPKKKAE